MKKRFYFPLMTAFIIFLCLIFFHFPIKSINDNDQIKKKTRPAAPVLQKDLAYTENEIQKMTENDFVHLLKETSERLPTKADLKTIPAEEIHHTPGVIIQAGKDLGLIKEILNQHPAFEKKAMIFYQNCAKNENGITPIRALCLTNLMTLKKKNHENYLIDP